MSRLRIPPARFALVVAAAFSVQAASAAETLRWAPKSGETLKYALAQVFETKISAEGQESSNKAELNVDLTWKVGSVAADGTIELSQTIDRARTRITAPGLVLNYDSSDKKSGASPATQVWAKAYEAVLGKPYAIKLSPTGEIVEVTVPNEVKTALADSQLAAGADAGSFFSEAGVKNILAQILPKLPAGPVDQGATWDAELKLPSGPLNIGFKIKYSLAEAAPVARIDASLDTTVAVAPEAKLTVKITKQSGSARFAFDPAAGRLDSSTIKQSADMTLNDGEKDIAQTTVASLTFTRQK